jgi:hypothetical protein
MIFGFLLKKGSFLRKLVLYNTAINENFELNSNSMKV